MEVINLKPDHGLFVADDIIKTAKELQTYLASIHPEAQEEFAIEAIGVLGDPSELYGGSKVFVRTLGAIVLNQGKDISIDEELYHGTYFGEALLRSHFSSFAFVQHRMLRGLCLSLYDSSVLSSPTNREMEGENISSGVFVPVHSVESVLAA